MNSIKFRVWSRKNPIKNFIDFTFAYYQKSQLQLEHVLRWGTPQEVYTPPAGHQYEFVLQLYQEGGFIPKQYTLNSANNFTVEDGTGFKFTNISRVEMLSSTSIIVNGEQLIVETKDADEYLLKFGNPDYLEAKFING